MSTEIHAPIPQRIAHVGRMHLKPGMKAWEMDLKTGVITQLMYEVRESRNDSGRLNARRNFAQVDLKGKRYCVAINRKNAERKFKRGFSGTERQWQDYLQQQDGTPQTA